MKTRILSAVILLPLLLIVILALPKIVTAIIFGAAAAIAAYEMLYQTQLIKTTRLIVYCAVSAFLTAIWSWAGQSDAWGTLLVLAFFIALFSEMLASHIKMPFETICICFVAGLIIPYLFTALIRIHAMRPGRFYIVIPFLMAFLPDSGAYFAGRFFGKHKLAPVISPKKTVEGAIGGVAACVVGMLLYGLILLLFDFRVNFFYTIFYGILGGGGSVLGDLCFSVIKRQTGIKDYGNLIPGHGGILDRFDSMMIVAPLTEALLLLIPMAVI